MKPPKKLYRYNNLRLDVYKFHGRGFEPTQTEHGILWMITGSSINGYGSRKEAKNEEISYLKKYIALYKKHLKKLLK